MKIKTKLDKTMSSETAADSKFQNCFPLDRQLYIPLNRFAAVCKRSVPERFVNVTVLVNFMRS